jgi:hypothetical protein
MNQDYERLRVPIDWLAANGLTCRSFDEQFPEPEKIELPEFPVNKMRSLARSYRDEKGVSLSRAYEEISQALGYKNFHHYQDHMKTKGKYKTSQQLNLEKHTKSWVRKNYGNHR